MIALAIAMTGPRCAGLENLGLLSPISAFLMMIGSDGRHGFLLVFISWPVCSLILLFIRA